MTLKVPLPGQVKVTAGRVVAQLPLDSARSALEGKSQVNSPSHTRRTPWPAPVTPSGAPVPQVSGGTPPAPTDTVSPGRHIPTSSGDQPQLRSAPEVMEPQGVMLATATVVKGCNTSAGTLDTS